MNLFSENFRSHIIALWSLFPLAGLGAVADDKPQIAAMPIVDGIASRESREAFMTSGSLEWLPSGVRMEENAALALELQSGPTAMIRLTFEKEPGDGSPTATATLDVGFQGANDLQLLLRFPDAGSQDGVLAILQSAQTDTGREQVTLAEEPVVFSNGSITLTIVLRFGLVSVSTPDSTPILAHGSSGGSDLSNIRLAGSSGIFSVSDLKISGTPPSPPVTDSEAEKLQRSIEMNQQMIAAFQQGNYSDAEALAHQVLSDRSRILGPEHRDCAESLSNLGMIAARIGRYTEAEQFYLRAITILENTCGPMHPDYNGCIGNYAALLTKLARYDAAQHYFLQSVRGDEALLGPQHPYVGIGLNNLAQLEMQCGEIHKAGMHFVQSAEVIRAAFGAESVQHATILSNLGGMYRRSGDFAAGESQYRRALQIMESVRGPEHPDVATCLANLAQLLNAADKPASATPLLRRALKIRQAAFGGNHPLVAYSLNDLGMNAAAAGTFAEAVLQYQKALQILETAAGTDTPEFASSLINLSEAMAALGKHDESARLLNRSATIYEQVYGKDHPEYADALNRTAFLLERSSMWKEAQRKRADAYSILSRELTLTLPFLPAAEAAARLEQFEHSIAPYVNLLVRLNAPPATIYSVATFGKNAASRIRLRTESGQSRSAEVRSLQAEIADANLAILEILRSPERSYEEGTYSTQLNSALDRKTELERKMSARKSLREPALSPERGIALQIPQALPPESVFIDFVRYESLQPGPGDSGPQIAPQSSAVYDAFIWRRTKDSGENEPMVRIPLGPASEIESALQLWRREITSETAPFNDIEEAGQRMNHLLWSPLSPYVPRECLVIISPDGALHNAPWPAIPTREGRLLIEDNILTTVQSAEDLLRIAARNSLQETPAAFLGGNFDYTTVETTPAVSGDSFPPLPGTERELLRLADAFSELHRIVTLSGEDARESAVLRGMADCDLIHLATHAYFEGTEGTAGTTVTTRLFPNGVIREGGELSDRIPYLTSGLAVSGANRYFQAGLFSPGDDGIITAEELARASLQGTRIMTLSACETARGTTPEAHGAFGLQQAARQAGVHSVIASLWRVPDAATQELMVHFYKNLLEKDQPCAVALRNAQLRILRSQTLADGTELVRSSTRKRPAPQRAKEPRRKYTHPWFWSAWTLSGDWR